MNNGHSKPEYTPLDIEPTDIEPTEEHEDYSDTLDAFVVNSLRAIPKAWLPDPDDEAGWNHFVSAAQTEADALDVDLEALIAEANEKALQEWTVSLSPRAARAALGDYLKQCRTAVKIDLSSVAENIPSLCSNDIRQWEDKSVSLYQKLENRENLFVDWLRCIEARWSRVLRLIRCSSIPPEWQEIADGPRVVYSPAGVPTEQTEYPLPQRAQNVIERLEAAWLQRG